MLDIAFLRTAQGAYLPAAHGERSVAIDLCSAVDVEITGGVTMVNTGVILAPDSYEDVSAMFLSLRSGFAIRNCVWMPNAPGVIEPNFAGFEITPGKHYGITVPLITPPGNTVRVTQGDRIAQLSVYSRGGNLLIPDESYSTGWYDGVGGSNYANYDTWYREIGPGANGRGGFGSTGG